MMLDYLNATSHMYTTSLFESKYGNEPSISSINLRQIKRELKEKDDHLRYWKRRATHLQELVKKKQRQKTELATLLDVHGIEYPEELHSWH
ncbi:uncharacterized protein BX663DRAFT_515927 [Cokeromyces recurvatus]|uniref:uncharacterized protein n=1 Tax=Cokeromyces recurvatus TaxID=90255 RepID=UPI00222050C6|nr:uncharacterized protein BX663DRAFT_515927 [Cokeromyces recurvatus]KAI7900985.1 hypothetical protein BX663DRAFT_515927 [Cokeromyces recurvatus]